MAIATCFAGDNCPSYWQTSGYLRKKDTYLLSKSLLSIKFYSLLEKAEAKRMEYKKQQSFDTSIILPTLERLENDPTVIGVMVVGNDGYPIRSSLDSATTINYLENFGSLIELARYTVKNMDPSDELNFLRMRTKDYEVMIAPEKEYSLLVLQKENAATISKRHRISVD
ncbi:dynein light chain roadblock-type 2-like [Dendronephthya gigantea]|uniref:dynein light chain roadblock-type 2-like n=1 Tax=Dendronephthya gigantea TaxID=151771 RepID=UPI00106C7D59|nr:dynein light chain roadblock-type 2-like [Dendronephthya gigantea]